MPKSFSRGDVFGASKIFYDLGRELDDRRREKDRLNLAIQDASFRARDQQIQETQYQQNQAQYERMLPHIQEAQSRGFATPAQNYEALQTTKKEQAETAKRTARALYLRERVADGTLTEEQAVAVSQGLNSDLSEANVLKLALAGQGGDDNDALWRFLLKEGAVTKEQLAADMLRGPQGPHTKTAAEFEAEGRARLQAEKNIAGGQLSPALNPDLPTVGSTMQGGKNVPMAEPAYADSLRGAAQRDASRAVSGLDNPPAGAKPDVVAGRKQQAAVDFTQSIATAMFPDMTADDLVKPTPQMKALAVEYINAATVQERQSVVEKIKKLAKNRANLFTTESTRGSALQRMEPFTREP
jgi:hypothetical protein